MLAAYDIALIPLIVALIELLKGAGLPKRWLPIVSVVLGIAGGIIYICPDDFKGGIIIGLMLGLSASGLYSGSKHMIEKNDEKGDL